MRYQLRMTQRGLVIIGFLGTTLDAGRADDRWDRWRPTVALARHDLRIHRLDLLHGRESSDLAAVVSADVVHASPGTRVVRHQLDLKDPWDFEEVYGALHDFARSYPFDIEKEDYLVHITTGTHVHQICLFLLAESRHFPARLVQTASQKDGTAAERAAGTYAIIDLDLSRYDRLAARFLREKVEGQSLLKQEIETLNVGFNQLIERIEYVAIASRAPVLLTGPTGAGKSKLARRMFELKKARRQVVGEFAEVNCATLRGDAAMSTLFGHKKGAFTGAVRDRAGLLMKANHGVLFLDEVGELGLDEQAMLLGAIEEKRFCPMGSDQETTSDFQLFCGTNRDLSPRIARGEFREDLFARINLWTFRLPALHERPEDIPPNLDFELQQASKMLGVHVTMNRDARDRFLAFATSWTWPGNFRDFNAAVTRMATLAPGGRITADIALGEVDRLQQGRMSAASSDGGSDLLLRVVGAERTLLLDRFDRVQLQDVLAVCRNASSLSAAGRELFANSRSARRSVNDADRLRKYLAKFEIDFAEIAGR